MTAKLVKQGEEGFTWQVVVCQHGGVGGNKRRVE